jgi:heme exporter protein C
MNCNMKGKTLVISGGNPALNGSDMSAEMRIVFWPAVLGFSLLGVWITTLKIRLKILEAKQLENE